MASGASLSDDASSRASRRTQNFLKRDKRRAIRELHKAVAAKQVDLVEGLISKCQQLGADVDFQYDKLTALEIAVLNNCEPLCRKLIDHGADVNKSNPEGNSLLNMASWRGYYDVAQLLIDNNAELDTCNDLGFTTLNAVARKGNLKIARLLCEAECDLNTGNTKGHGPLMTASWEGDQEMVEVLLQAGADIDRQDRERRTALILATERGHSDVVSLLIQSGCNMNTRQEYGRTALYYAAGAGEEQIVKHLIKGGADLDLADSRDRTPFFEAVNGQHLNCVKLLWEAGCDVNLPEREHKQAPIHVAVRLVCQFFDSNMSLVSGVVAAGCDVDAADKAGWTPLYQACFGGETEVVRLLLQNKATVHAQTEYGDTPLHGAVFGNKQQIFDMLIKAGSKVNQVNIRNELPLYNAIENRATTEIIEMLLEAGSQTDVCENKKDRSPLFAAIEQDYTEAVHLLIKSGCDVNTPNHEGSTPLWVGCDKGNEDIVRTLLSHPDVELDAGVSHIPLHAAVIHGYTGIVEVLLEADCNVNKLTDICSSAIYFAAERDNIPLAKLLLKWGANPSAPHLVRTPRLCCRKFRDAHPHFELEPLQMAIRNDSFMMVKLIFTATPKMPARLLMTLRDLLFRTSYAHEANLAPRLMLQYAHFFTGILSKPRSLQEECRGVIRQTLGTKPQSKIQHINLPSKLKDYILLTALLEE